MDEVKRGIPAEAQQEPEKDDGKFDPVKHLTTISKGSRGYEYLHVKWRVMWFRDEHPDWAIETSIVSCTDKGAVFLAKIADANGRTVSTAHGSETEKDFRDFLEKAETKAIGRALAFLGYGTQFAADELDEGDRIVDAPVEAKAGGQQRNAAQPQQNRQSAPPVQQAPVPLQTTCADCGAPILDCTNEDGKIVSAERLIARSRAKFGRCLCYSCGVMAAEKERG